MTIEWLTAILDFPSSTFDLGNSFWQSVTGSTLSSLRGDLNEFASLVPNDGDAFLRVQRTSGPLASCHLDLHAEDENKTVTTAQQLGASLLYERQGLTVLASPGGLSFCVVGHHGESRRPAPLVWSEGHRSLVDQLCIDVPPKTFDEECGFWSNLTKWELHIGSRPEFEYLTRPSSMPLRILFQRLDDEGFESCHAHLDLASTDVERERQRHQELGAEVVRVMPNWTTMKDPTGLSYCITRRNPDSGTLLSMTSE